MRRSHAAWCRRAGGAIRAVVLVVSVAIVAALAYGCGDGSGAYLGGWLESSQQTSALRVTDATGRVLVDYLDLTRPVDDQTVFSTEATAQGDILRLRYESSADGQVVKGGTLKLTGDGAALVWTTGSGARREFRKVTVLPSTAP